MNIINDLMSDLTINQREIVQKSPNSLESRTQTAAAAASCDITPPPGIAHTL